MKSTHPFIRLHALAVILTLSRTALAHMEMKWPIPFRSKYDARLRAAQIDYNMMAPLSPDGSDFPCKGYEYDTIQGATADFEAGQTYNVSLAGTIMHGGGSCQIAMSYDHGRTFKVIKSIIGGCPYKMNYDFTVPSYAPDGTAILAWTWQNNVGNREFYMNCAEVQVAGASSSRKRQESVPGNFGDLPSMWVANLPSINSCRTTENVSPVYPHPGDDVEYGAGYNSSTPPTAGDCEFPAEPTDTKDTGEASVIAKATVEGEALLSEATAETQPALSTTGMPVMAVAQETPYNGAQAAAATSVGEYDDLLQRLYNVRYVATTASPAASAATSTEDPASAIAVYTTISACPSESVSTIYRPPTSSTWTTSYTTRRVSASPTPTSLSPDIIPFPPPSPPYIATADQANESLLPCVPGTRLCQSPSAFLACAPTPPESSYAGSRTYIYGSSRQVADGMACLPFLSPYSSGAGSGEQGQQITGVQGRYRDDRYIRDRQDGSCPADREGVIRCTDDGLGFFVCDQGGWVDMGPTAQGTVCRGGEIVAA
ncbi:Hypothetical protein D9617_9g025280 [Elsinoe fawcettii]|nr:Hypothetical protein D9617_9g025280 [Elsinoe fawcettii]